ncbi:MAG: TIGR00730 family Rossman fold protein [Bacteroidota bacterium]
MNVCVFCGSGVGHNPVYASAAKELALLFCKTNTTLVYGGGNIGLMGILADEVLRNQGQVVGIIPDFLVQREVGHQGITRLEIVKSMHERKKRMADLADVFIALPGGLGTLDELAEILTWKQLKLIRQPVGLLNTNAYFDPLINQMKLMVDSGFLREENFQDLQIHKAPAILLALLGITAA